MQFMRVAVAARGTGAVVLALGLTLVPGSPASAANADTGGSRLLIPSAGWHGRPIQEPHRHEAVRTSVADTPLRGWSAGAVSFGTGFHRAGGSDRVREVQRRLRRLGYRAGPIDGLFGPLTRASVAWFQVKHGMRVNGRATLELVRHLRARTGAGGGGGPARADHQSVSTAPSAASRPRPWEAFRQLVGARAAVVNGPSAHQETPLFWIALVIVLALLVIGAVALWRLAAASPGRAPRWHPDEARRTEAGQVGARALAYVLIADKAYDSAGLRDHAAAIETECAERELQLAGVLSDVEDARPIWKRPGLATAVGRLVTGDVDLLIVTKLDAATSSGADLQSVVDAAKAEVDIGRRPRPLRASGAPEVVSIDLGTPAHG